MNTHYVDSRQHTQITQLLPLKEKYYKCMDCGVEGRLGFIHSAACSLKKVNKLWIGK